jgi:hypothetical protein
MTAVLGYLLLLLYGAVETIPGPAHGDIVLGRSTVNMQHNFLTHFIENR